MTRRRGNQRRGSVYVLVLAVAALVAIVGTAGALASRIERRSVRLVSESEQARLLARSALEWGLQSLTDDSAGTRAALASQKWARGVDLDAGAFGLVAEDPLDGDLLDDPAEPIQLVGIGWSGSARHLIEANIVFVAGAPTLRDGSLAQTLGSTLPAVPVRRGP